MKHQVAQKPPRWPQKANVEKRRTPKTQCFRGPEGDFVSLRYLQVPEAGVETSASAQGNTTLSESGGTSGGTLPEGTRLQAVVDAWRLLNERERLTILKIIHTSSEQSQDV